MISTQEEILDEAIKVSDEFMRKIDLNILDYLSALLGIDYRELVKKYKEDPVMRPILKVLTETMQKNKMLELLK